MKKLVIILGLILVVGISGLFAQEKEPKKEDVKKEKDKREREMEK